MIKTLFVFSDVHGEYDALIESLSEAKYDPCNPNHKLISLGDNFDRGPKSKEVFDFLVKNNAVCILGNHEDMLIKALRESVITTQTLLNCSYNGLMETLCSFISFNFTDNRTTFFAKNIKNMIENVKYYDSFFENKETHKTDFVGLYDWLLKLPLYYETKNFIFVHAGIRDNNHWKDTDRDYMLWDIGDSYKPIYNISKKVVIGHHHAAKVRELATLHGVDIMEKKHEIPYYVETYGCIDENRPVFMYNKIAIDSCSNLTKKVNVLVFKDEIQE